MTTTTMHFGPEWMRTKQPPSARANAMSSPPPASASLNAPTNCAPTPPGAASYSALVTPPTAPTQDKLDTAHPFKYSRDEMLHIWKEGGGCSVLPIEVELWGGIVRETAGEPVCLRELSDAEKKLYASSLNSELRRRPSMDYSAQGDRSKPNHGGPQNNGLSGLVRRRRGDSNGTDHPVLSLARKSSWSNVPGSLTSPALASPRTRLGGSNGFDGVLNGNDNNWGGGKRRVSTGQPFTSRVDEEPEGLRESGTFEIKEKEESPRLSSDEAERRASSTDPTSVPSANVPSSLESGVNNLSSVVDRLTLHTRSADLQDRRPANTGDMNSNLIQPDVLDLSKVQWSYVDLKGDLQGPFPGETMQFWHDQNYFFTDNLMMKRTHIDAEFMPLAEVKRRAQGERIFLSPLVDIVLPPPGLGHILPGSGLNPILHRTGLLDSPHQPTPQTFGRSSTLDSYINNDTTASASPSSSFGSNFGHPSISPDHVAIGNRLMDQRFAADIPLNGRLSAGSFSSNSSPAVTHPTRHVFNDAMQTNRSSSLVDAKINIPWQTPQSINIQEWDNPPETIQLNQMGRPEPIGASPGGYAHFMREPSYARSMGHPTPVDPLMPPSGPSHRLYEQADQADFMGTNLAQRDGHDLPIDAFQQFPSDSPTRFGASPLQFPLPPLSSGLVRDFNQVPSSVAPSPTVGRLQPQMQTRQPTPLSTWSVPQAREPQRPRPFDADRPTSSNTFLATPATTIQRSAWVKPSFESQPQATSDPWSSSQQAEVPDSLKQPQLTEERRSLTTANVNQHNEHQGSTDPRQVGGPIMTENNASVQVSVGATLAASSTTPAVPIPSTTSETAIRPPSSKRKGAATIFSAVAPEHNKTSAVSKVSAASPSSQRPAWATDEDVKSKQNTAPMSLREIQEVEKKKQESRKAAEKERAARAAIIPMGEEVQFTASWGLPTSQTGTRSNGISTSKDTNVSSSSSPSVPVWTNAKAKPVAKTMKEIQEEEERRKLQASKDKETIASAAKRATQIPAAKGPLATQQSGGAWTVVGSGGKPPVSAGTISPRPAPAVQVSSLSATTTASRLSGIARPSSSSQTTKVVTAAPKIEEPGAPSLEFLKWMRDSMKGLNSSVQFEEIAHMLLSFPLDPDPSTVEIIAETVYGASTTLDGRRFAAEFIAKRKSDLAMQPRSLQGFSGANGKQTLLADVVKAQPKQAQNEFGGYKVVKKKNKGGRS